MSAGLISLAVALGAFAAAWLLAGAVRGYAAARLVDVPNARSSHARATPRGGGIAIVSAFLAGLGVLAATGVVPLPLALALGPGAAAVAAIGWADDHAPVPARWRALVHFAAAFWALGWLGGFPALSLGRHTLQLGAAGWVIGALGVVWVINLYNFMDGVDGIAAGEAVSAGMAAAGLLALGGAPHLAALPLLLACASGGFLLWNWQPARMFMGDVGSGTLGFIFSTLALASENAGRLPLLAWVMLLGVFVFDATATLLRRLWRGERIYEAHRTHAYQRATQAGISHARVSLAVLGLNLLLAAAVLLVVRRPALLLPAWCGALALLAVVYLAVERLRPMLPPPAAGEPSHPRAWPGEGLAPPGGEPARRGGGSG